MLAMDASREIDIQRLNAEIARTDITSARREQLKKNRAKIIAQLSNNELMAKRVRLNKASISGDGPAAERIANQITDKFGQ